MYLLDTNVVSELMRAAPSERVVAWIAGQDGGSLFLSAPTEAELRLGIAQMPPGKRRDALSREVTGTLEEDFADRILPFDSPAAAAFAEIVILRRAMGRPIAVMDAQIAAIAKARRFTLVTRNTRDFGGLDLPLADPFAPLP